MTRKQYKRKMMQFQRNVTAWAKQNGYAYGKNTDKINMPNWGRVITTGPHKGEILRSYAQAWETVKDVLGTTDFLNGISL